MAARKSLTITLHTQGVRETLLALRRLPKEANDALRTRSQELAESMAGHIAAAARADSPQSALMAPTVRAVRDRVPAITAGGTKRVGSRRVPAYKILFGSEFGSTRLPQFRPHLGKGSYWLFATFEARSDVMMAAWLKAADDIVASFGDG